MSDNLQTKITKLITYSKAQLATKGVTSTTTTLRGVLDDIANISIGDTQATLNAPTISLKDNILTLTNPTTNGDFATGFNIYNGTTLLATQLINITTLDLSTPLAVSGTHIITAKCYGTNMAESDASNSVRYVVDPLQYLTFNAEDGNTFTLNTYNTSKGWNGTLEYSTDKTSWNTWNGELINSSSDGKLYLLGINNTKITGNSSDYRFVFGGSSTKIQCNGNIESLLDYTTVANGNHPTMAFGCYFSIFSGCTSLTTAPELPATTLADYCYQRMFYGCTSLTTAPELPATKLSEGCYFSIFSGCTSLTTAPELPATTLADYCYQRMFYGCTSLTTAPELPATTLADWCYYSMFEDCTSLKVSETQTSEYQYAWRIPTSGTGTTATDWNAYMLNNTGGTFTSNPSINTTYYTTNQPVSCSKVYGVSGLYQSEPALTRTDDAIDMTYSINSTTGEITSDFSNVFPYNQMTRETINGNVFVNVPSMWWRITTDSDNRLTSVAVSNQRGSGDNWYQSRAFKYGAYGGSVSDDVLKSVSGVARKVSLTRANARTYAMANGTGYHQRDLYSYTILMFLWYIEFATKDSASIMYGANPNQVNTGGTDSLGFSTGYNSSTNQMIWHNIEDFIGNVYEWEDGTTTNGTAGSTQYVSADYTKYNDTGSGMNTLAFNSLSSYDWLTALGWDNNNPFLVQPIENSGGSSSTYFCDTADEGSYVVSSRGAYWDVYSRSGLSYFLRSDASHSNINLGCRLLYTP